MTEPVPGISSWLMPQKSTRNGTRRFKLSQTTPRSSTLKTTPDNDSPQIPPAFPFADVQRFGSSLNRQVHYHCCTSTSQ
jgi:hypothetical protein